MTKNADLSQIRGIVIDMDGTIYIGEQLFPWTERFLKSLDDAGIKRLFLTNNSAESTAEYAAKLRRLGVPVEERGVLTAGWATIHYLLSETSHRRIYLVGTPGLREEFEQNGLTVMNGDGADFEGEMPDAVVLGFDMTITYARIRKAATLIQDGVPSGNHRGADGRYRDPPRSGLPQGRWHRPRLRIDDRASGPRHRSASDDHRQTAQPDG